MDYIDSLDECVFCKSGDIKEIKKYISSHEKMESSIQYECNHCLKQFNLIMFKNNSWITQPTIPHKNILLQGLPNIEYSGYLYKCIKCNFYIRRKNVDKKTNRETRNPEIDCVKKEISYRITFKCNSCKHGGVIADEEFAPYHDIYYETEKYGNDIIHVHEDYFGLVDKTEINASVKFWRKEYKKLKKLGRDSTSSDMQYISKRIFNLLKLRAEYKHINF